eukprot:1150293-Pelagomonas_calceolata.AAC.3
MPQRGHAQLSKLTSAAHGRRRRAIALGCGCMTVSALQPLVALQQGLQGKKALVKMQIGHNAAHLASRYVLTESGGFMLSWAGTWDLEEAQHFHQTPVSFTAPSTACASPCGPKQTVTTVEVGNPLLL